MLLLVLILSSVPLVTNATPFQPRDAYGHLLTMSDHLIVQASNHDYLYRMMNVDQLSSETCSYSGSTNEYIYSVDMGKDQDSGQIHFVAVGLNIINNTQFVRIYNGTDVCEILNEHELPTNVDKREFFVMSVDSSGKTAFGLSMGVFFVYDLLNYNIQMKNYTEIWNTTMPLTGPTLNTSDQIIPFAMEAVSTELALVAAYLYIPYTYNYYPTVCVLTWASVQNWSDSSCSYSNSYRVICQDYSCFLSLDLMTMSISVQDSGPFALFGLPQYDTVFMIKFNSASINQINSYSAAILGVGYGQSLVWLWNNTAAIASYSQAVSPWSLSRVEIVQFDSNKQISTPLYTLPNNQQPSSVESLNSTIRIIVTSPSYLAILFEPSETILVFAISPATMCSQHLTSENPSILIMNSTYCIPGTYNANTTLGPCDLCPPGTRNPGNLTASACIPCALDSFCPLGSIDDIPATIFENISQALAYPESPDVIIFDDILIQAMFSLGSTPYCILVSPLFWTVIVIGIAFVVVITLGIMKFIPRIRRHRTFITRVFQQIDLVREGELWIGGLVSFGIVVLVTFAYMFSISYMHLYPIEDVNSAPFACDKTMRNAKFSTSLQPLITPRNEEEEPIFELLDAQLFTLEVSFIQTLFDCDSLTIQQSVKDNLFPLQWLNCSYGIEIPASQTVSLVLPFHKMTVIFNLAGPHYIGGAYVCLRGPAETTDTVYSIQTLSSCQMFYTENQTLARTSETTIELTKVINRTTGLSANDRTKFSGIWIPTFIVNNLDDSLFFFHRGNYLRYLTNVTTFQVTFSETPYFIKNTQDPIARGAEVIFHNILFTIMTLEIFGLVFLIVKLTIAPLFRLVIRKTQGKTANRVDIVNEED